MNICEHLTVTSGIFPHREALRFDGRSYSYAELNQLSAAASAGLTAGGVGSGDRVAIMLGNSPAFAIWYYAILRLGAVAVSVSTRLTDREVNFLVEDCEAIAFVAESGTMARVGKTLPPCVQCRLETSETGEDCGGTRFETSGDAVWLDTEPDEPALILYTSGTTGFAKGAVLSHMNVRSNVHAFNHLCGMQPDDRILLAVPLFHCFGQNALLNSGLNAGATLVLQRKFDPQESRKLIREEGVTQLYGVPAMFQLLHDICEPRDLASVTYCFSAAATLPMQVGQRWHEKFAMPIHEGYGLTECSPFASYNHRLKHVPGSIGTPVDCVEMRIVDTETGETSAPGKLGEIAIRGPNVMLGYWKRPSDTAEAIREGWLYSGDIGRVDEEGFYYIVDRVKDMIAVGGLKVFPAEVERVLLDHAIVSQVAVVGVPDEVFGEKVVAYVVREKSADNQDAEVQAAGLMRYAKDNLANYKVPRHIVFISELPRNPAGKVLKTELRSRTIPAVADAATASVDSRSSGDTADEEPGLRSALQTSYAAARHEVATRFVQEKVQRLLDTDEPPEPSAAFLELGLDSMQIVELSQRIQFELGADHSVATTLVFDHPRISDLAKYLVDAVSTESPADDAPSQTEEGNLIPDSRADSLRREVEVMSEEEALQELLKEIED